MATRTAHAATQEKVAETKRRSDANGRAEKEARQAINEIVDEKAKANGVPAEPKKRTRRPPVEREHEATTNGQVEEWPKRAPKPAAKSTPKKAVEKAPAVPAPEGFKSWTDPKLATAVVRMKTKEKKSIKAIAEALGLPAVHRSWFLVSKVWRETADAKGIDRPRLSEEAIEARKAKRSK